MKRNYIDKLEDAYVASLGPSVDHDALAFARKQLDIYLNRVFNIDNGYIGDYTAHIWDVLGKEYDRGVDPYYTVRKMSVELNLDEATRKYIVDKTMNYDVKLRGEDEQRYGKDVHSENIKDKTDVAARDYSTSVWFNLWRKENALPSRDIQPPKQADPPPDTVGDKIVEGAIEFNQALKEGITGTIGYTAGVLHDSYKNAAHGDDGKNGLMDLFDSIFSDLLGVDTKTIIFVVIGLAGLYVAVEVKEIIK